MSSTSLISGKKPEVAIGPLSPASDIVVGPVEGVRLWRVAWRNDIGRLFVYDCLHSLAILPGQFSMWPMFRPMIARCLKIRWVDYRTIVHGKNLYQTFGLVMSRDSNITVTDRGVHVFDISSINGESPNLDCKCGIYAYKMCQEVIPEIQHEIIRELACVPFIVVGTVSLWGKIVEHELGYRAQFAYPSRLALVFRRAGSRSDPYKMASQIADVYGVSCRAVSSNEILQHVEWSEWHRIILGDGD